MILLSGIKKNYTGNAGLVEALRGIDLTIETGEYLAICGHSGSGKSTLMNILGCLDSPSAGRYFLHGQDVTNASRGMRTLLRSREIGFIFQSYNLVPRLTAVENVELPLLFRGVPRRVRRRQAEEALRSVGLGERLRHFPDQLSGGQQQRVAIARVLAAKPPLILADEPTGSLDRRSASLCMALLSRLNRDGHTVVLITHDPVCAAQARRRITLTDGVITEESRA